MNLKLNKEIEIPTSFANLMEEDSTITSQLPFLTSNIKFLFVMFWIVWGKNMKRKNHNMLYLMLNPKFKSLCLVSLIIGHC
jgi:hypothetical protein